MSGIRKRRSNINDNKCGQSAATTTNITTTGGIRYVKHHSVSTYHSMVSDLRHRRTVHCVEHYPCLPDPQRVAGTEECGTVHYGFCVPVTIVESPDDNSHHTQIRVDPVRLLSSPDLEGHLKSLVNHFVARDKATQARSGKSRPQSPASPTSSSRSSTSAFTFSTSPSKLNQSPQFTNGGHCGSIPGQRNAEDTLGQLLLDMKAAVGTKTDDGNCSNGGSPDSTSPKTNAKNGEISLQSPVDYAKKRFQLSQDMEAERKLKAVTTRVPVNGIPHLVSETKTRFENGIFNQVDVRWKSEWLPTQPTPTTSSTKTEKLTPTLAKYNYLLHPESAETCSGRGTNSPRNKSPSPEPGVVSPQLPHPKLTSIQKQHIRERALSPPAIGATLTNNAVNLATPTVASSGSFPVKPFLTKGSVAERVLIFERCPVLDRGANRTHQHHPSKPLFNTWKTNQNYATAAIVCSESTTADLDSKTQKHKQKENREPISILAVANAQQQALPKKLVTSNGHRHHTNQNRRAQQQYNQLPIPQFYFPSGRPISSNEVESQLTRISQVFSRFDKQEISKDQFGVIVKACSLPLYCKVPMFTAAAGSNKNCVTSQSFLDYWKRVLASCFDLPSKFVNILTRSTRPYLLPEDFITLIQDIIDTHPGLTFLKEAEEFHSRYVQTVIARIYYSVNRSWSGVITLPELKKSNFLQVLSLLEEEDDINQITEYFSYEHFYVIYCKFWELDKDHDLLIDRNDLSRHNDGAISSRMINRIFSGAVTRGNSVHHEDKLSYPEFVWFLLSEEDKRHPTSIEYWFRCMDFDGDGYLSMYELEYFYEEQLQRMDALGIEALPFQDCLCQMLDMIIPKVPGKISLSDLKRCKMTPIFFDTFFNLEKYLDHEQKDPFAFQRDQDGEMGNETSDWNRYASQEYELLVAEEGATDQDELLYDDDYGGDEEDMVVHFGNVTIDDKSSLKTNPRAQRKDALDLYGNDDDYADYAESDDYQY
ncbi:Serine/threonine-protein phosphatase 2A regulatory subunit B'' subunit alpha [Chamberlinius hualienensis]